MKTACEPLFAELRTLNVEFAQEGFVDRFVLKSIDAFVRLFSNQVHVLNKLFTGEIRSEYEYYSRSNMSMVYRIQGLKFEDVMHLPVDVPDGMYVGYLPAVTLTIEQIYRLSPKDLTSQALSFLNVLHRGNIFEAVSGMQSATNQIQVYDRAAIGATMSKIFSKKSVAKLNQKPFAELFANMAEFKSCCQRMGETTDIYNLVRKAHGDIILINEALSNLLDEYEGGRMTIDKRSAVVLHKYFLTLAQQMDIYSALIIELQRIEHNFVLVLRALYNNVK